jgi:excisionase family DNA binding protein
MIDQTIAQLKRLRRRKWNLAFREEQGKDMNIKEAKELPIYLTLKEVAQLLKVKPRTIYAWVSDKRIPYERKGGLLRFRLEAILAWNEPVR